ncbi:MAG: toxin glutamine deamidase domain-containing protein [Candidatus Azobacteroides sp.]|nr:toxin glutamine deamidase domain-containing protein [Candidatus Azobacteroides sp.]
MSDLDKILKIIEQAPEEFESKIPDTEKKIFGDILLLLKDLKLSADGRITASVENLKLINEIKARLGKIVVSKEYSDAVKKFVSNIPTVFNYQTSAFDLPKESKKMMSEVAKAQIDKTLENLIGAGYKRDVVSSLYDTLLTSVTSGGSYADLTEQLRNQLISTEEKPGMLSRYAKTYVVDALGQFAGQGNAMIADALNSEWFQYIGSNLTTTREFCEHLTKKRYVHKSEIPELLTGMIDGHQCEIYEKTGLPKGMKEDTTPENFIVNRGGWRCGHELIPVDKSTVPKAIRDKIKKEPDELELLDIEIQKVKELADEYGVGTKRLDAARQTQDINEIKNAINTVRNLATGMKGKYESLLGEVQSVLQEAKAAKIDASILKALESRLISNKADYGSINQDIINAVNSIKTAVAQKTAQQFAATSTNTQKTKERIINDKEIEVKLNITQGKEMDFDQANKGYGNKNYSKGGGYKINCQSCVVANELRRRGFDVTAMENTKKKGNVPYELSTKTNLAWIDPKTGKMPNKGKAGGQYINGIGDIRIKPIKQLEKELISLIKDTGRYHIDWTHKNKTSGHIITLEKLPDGKIVFYDPQTGLKTNWSEIRKDVSLKYGVHILRVDNLNVNVNIVNGIVTK